MAIETAIITDASIEIASDGNLTAWLILEYKDSCRQKFGGYKLDRKYHGPELERIGSEFGTTFIRECLRIIGADKWDQLKGKIVRVTHVNSRKPIGIGNHIKEIWFFPRKIHQIFFYRERCREASLKKLKEIKISNITASLIELGGNIHAYHESSRLILSKLLEELEQGEIEIEDDEYYLTTVNEDNNKSNS